MWRCCICRDGQIPSVQEYAMHLQDWHPEWFEGRQIPPPAYLSDEAILRREERTGWGLWD